MTEEHKTKHRESNNSYYRMHKDEIRSKLKDRYHNDTEYRERAKARVRAWYAKHREWWNEQRSKKWAALPKEVRREICKKQNEYVKAKRQADPARMVKAKTEASIRAAKRYREDEAYRESCKKRALERYYRLKEERNGK
jgi:hypothetical protein